MPNGDTSRGKRRSLNLRARAMNRQFECLGDQISLAMSFGLVSRKPTSEDKKVEVKDRRGVTIPSGGCARQGEGDGRRPYFRGSGDGILSPVSREPAALAQRAHKPEFHRLSHRQDIGAT